MKRNIYPEVHTRIEYKMTEEGKSLKPVLESIAAWERNRADSRGTMIKVQSEK